MITFNFLRICELAEYQPNEYSMKEKKEDSVIACGPSLANLMALVCEGQYNSKGKRVDHTCELTYTYLRQK